MTTPHARGSRAWKVLLIAGAALMFVSGVLVVTARTILDPDRFGANIATSLGDERVAAYVAGQLTDAVIAARPNLLAVRPILLSTITSVVHSGAFRAAVRSSARSAHRFFFEQAGSRLVLSLPDMGAVLRSAISQASPDLAAKIPPGLEATLSSGDAERTITMFIRIWRLGDRLLMVSWVAWYIGILMVVGAIWLSPDRRVGLAEAGVALIVVAVAYAAVVPAARILASARFLDDPALAGFISGVVKAFLIRLRVAALLVGIPGLILLSAGTAYLEKFSPRAMARHLWQLLVTPPAFGWRMIVWSLVLIGAGAVALLWPMQLVTALMILVGLSLIHTGLSEGFKVVVGRVTEAHGAAPAFDGRRWPMVAGALVLIVGIGGVGGFLLSRGGTTAVAADELAIPATCNGSAELCDLRVDEVVFAGAHNAMSNASVEGWMFPHHGNDMVHMLDAGIRMLAIDIHYGIPTGGRIKTDIEHEVASRDKIAEALGTEGVAAAMRIRDRLVGGDEGPQGIYFCHGFCELGAYETLPVLTQIKDWLAANRGEVVILVIEDYIAVNQLDSLFKASGLFDYVYTGSMTNWSTLGEIVAANQRLIVFTESGNRGVAYLHSTAGIIQETPYTFHTAQQFSCRPNRGGRTGSLFMINHWLETTPAPRPTNAEVVNAYDFLLRRARACQRERRKLPNVIMTDFYDIGDVVRVANTMNGLDTAQAAAARP